MVPHFPAYAGKAPFHEEILSPGGQVASAMVTCASLGLRTKYIGTVGDDERGRIQMESLLAAGVDLEHVQMRRGCATQSAYIIIDRTTGERTVLWRRDDCLRLEPAEITPEQITCARLLHIDGHDTARRGARRQIARRPASPSPWTSTRSITASTACCPMSTTSSPAPSFPVQWTNESDPFKALETIQREYKMRVAAMTLGAHGALALDRGKFIYSPAFVVDCVDTTGAGDVFHGAFCYAVLQGMPMREALDFSNAMAALNCTALGARGGIRGVAEAKALMARAGRRSRRELEIHGTGIAS